MTDKPELNWEQLNRLTAEVISDDGPWSEGWTAERTHTHAFNEAFIDTFRKNGGVIPGELGEVNMVLVTVTGAKSGTKRVVPLSYHLIDDRIYVIASMGGAKKNPPLFYNVKAHPEVIVEIGDETYPAVAQILDDEARTPIWDEVVRRMPIFGEYETRTNRVIPVIELVRQ